MQADTLFDVRGKVALVTGASSGLGEHFARMLAERGATVIAAARRVDRLEALVAGITREGGKAIAVRLDVADRASVDAALDEAVKATGAPDIVVNNAGVYPRTGVLINLDPAEYDRIMTVNVRAPFLVVQAMARLMIARGVHGAVVNIGSGAARQMPTGSVTYCMSKTALERLSKGQALELAPDRIRVNVVEPGFAPGSDFSYLPPDYVERMTARIPLGRNSEPGDAAGMVLYLCSQAASYITGAVVSCDGGNSIGTFQPATNN